MLYELILLLVSLVISTYIVSKSNLDIGILRCGLAGFSGEKEPDPYKLRILMLDNQARGIHSSGVHGRHLYREATRAAEFIKSDAFNNAVRANNVLTHTRHATMGKVNKENAHPFIVGTGDDKIVGTHNGWLIEEGFESALKYFDIEMPEVDSQMIYQGLEKTQDPQDLQHIEGTMALAYVQHDNLHLYRRQSKPLYIGTAKEGLYYSSRKEGLEMIGCSQITMLPVDELFTIVKGTVEKIVTITKPIISSIPLDCSPSGWRAAVPYIESSQFPIKYGMPKKTQAPPVTTTTPKKGGAGVGAGTTTATSSDQPVVTGTFKYAEATLKLYGKELGLDADDFNTLYQNRDFGANHIIFELRSSVTSGEIPFFAVQIEGYPELSTLADSTGHCAIKITSEMTTKILESVEPVRLLIYDPMNPWEDIVANKLEPRFYTSDIRNSQWLTKNASVSEVILSLPFRQPETQKETRKDDLSGVGFLNSCFIQSHLVTEGKDSGKHQGLAEIKASCAKLRQSSCELRDAPDTSKQLSAFDEVPSGEGHEHEDEEMGDAAGHRVSNVLSMKFGIRVDDDGLPANPSEWDKLTEPGFKYFQRLRREVKLRKHQEDVDAIGFVEVEEDDYVNTESVNDAADPKTSAAWKALIQEQPTDTSLSHNYQKLVERKKQVELMLTSIEDVLQDLDLQVMQGTLHNLFNSLSSLQDEMAFEADALEAETPELVEINI